MNQKIDEDDEDVERTLIGTNSPYQMRTIRGMEFEDVVPWHEVIKEMCD